MPPGPAAAFRSWFALARRAMRALRMRLDRERFPLRSDITSLSGKGSSPSQPVELIL